MEKKINILAQRWKCRYDNLSKEKKEKLECLDKKKISEIQLKVIKKEKSILR